MTDSDELEDLQRDVENRLEQGEGRAAMYFIANALDIDADPDDEMVATAQAIAREIRELRDDLRDAKQDLNAIQDLGREKTTKEEKIAALVRYAQNVAKDTKRSRVALTWKDIKGTAGVSRRYAYDLIDDLPEEYAWLHDRADISQYGDLEIDKDAQDRALVVDLEALHSDSEAVNKFTTTTTRKEASA